MIRIKYPRKDPLAIRRAARLIPALLGIICEFGNSKPCRADRHAEYL